MAILKLDYLKTLFQQYDRPTEQDFADLIDTLSTTIDIVTYNVGGTGNVWDNVNSSVTIVHDQKQLTVVYHNGKTYLFDATLGKYGYGAISTTTNNYVDLIASQFTNEQVEQIIELITDDVTVIESLNIESFEKGLSTVINYEALIDHSDVTVTSIKLNNVSQQISTSGITTVTKSEGLTNSKSYVLVIDYIRLGVNKQSSNTISTTAYAPKFYGLSMGLDYDNQLVSTIPLTKYIGNSNTLEYSGVLNSMYLWFIVTETLNEIHDQNGLLFRVGNWTSDDFYIHKSGLITLANGTNEPVQFYRSKTTLESKGQNYKFEIDGI